MDKKITELREAEELTGSEYLVVASLEDEETYKVKVSDFVDTTIAVDETLSHTSKNPVQNKAITQHIVNIENRLGEVEEFTERLLDLKVAQVDTVTLKPEESAKVEIYDLGKDEEDIKKLGFKFYIPRGAKGSGGTSGTPEGTINSGGRTVFAFKSSQNKPKRPEGGHWDPETNKITYPNGWSSTDNLVPPIWMSNATFENYEIVIDWSEPIKITGEDGVSGTDGTSIEFIYKLFKDEQTIVPTPPSDPNLSDYVPEGWEDHPMGVTKDMRCEYICSRTKDDETGRWKEWSTPALWSKYGVDGRDGDSIEYIYQLSLSEKEKPITPGTDPSPLSPVTNYQEREFIPASAAGELDWTDNPTGVSEKFTCEWVSVRKFSFTTQQWEAFSEPALWAKYGENGKDGEPGTGIRVLGSYDSEDELNSAWQSGTLKGDNPPQTGDSYIVNGYIYVFDGDEFLNCGRLKGEPGESTYLHIKYSDDGISFTKGNGETIGKYIGIRVDYTEQDSDVFSDYTWSRFRGNDGFGYEYIFQLSTENVAPFVPTEITATGIAPEGWTADPTGVTSEIKYEWCCYRKSNEEGQWGPWTGRSGGSYAWLFAMWAESMPGETGKPGPILYPAGVWGEDIESASQKGSYVNGEWVATATPYVLHNGTFYILNVESSSQEPGTGGDWLKMEMFNAIYTDILLANNAKVGQAIFNGNFMFSQEGRNAVGSRSDEYMKFNAEDPYNNGVIYQWVVNRDETTGSQISSGWVNLGKPITTPNENSGLLGAYETYLELTNKVTSPNNGDKYIIGSNLFRPNWCVNLYTGEMWSVAGSVAFEKTNFSLGKWTIAEEGRLRSAYDNNNNYITIDPSNGVFINKLVSQGSPESSHKVALNIDGSGYLANQNISWNSDGTELVIGGGDSWHSNTVNITENGLIITPTNSPTTESIDLQITHNEIIIGRYFSGLKLDSDGVYTRTSPAEEWTPINKKSSGVQFVGSLPSNPDDDTLYVIV